MNQVGRFEPTVAEVRADCRKWRRLVAKCLKKDYVPPAMDEQYRVVHGRILSGCRSLADKQSLTELRREAIRQLDELLRPWSTAEALTGAPQELVIDLIHKEADLEKRLLGGPRRLRRLRKLILVALTAGLAGSMLAMIFHAWTAGLSRPLVESLWTLTGNMAARVRALDFADQFVVAVMFSWLFGTWLLSQVRKT